MQEFLQRAAPAADDNSRAGISNRAPDLPVSQREIWAVAAETVLRLITVRVCPRAHEQKESGRVFALAPAGRVFLAKEFCMREFAKNFSMKELAS